MHAAALLRSARARAGLTQRALAARAGIPQPTIADIECGKQDPRYRTLARLLEACGYELDILPRPGNGVDRTPFQATLRSSPTQRLQRMAQAARAARALASARRVDR